MDDFLKNNNAAVSDSPRLLKLVARLLSPAEEIRDIADAEQRRAETLCRETGNKEASHLVEPDWRDLASRRLIRRYSNRAALVGGATGALAIVPGIGTLAGSVTGATADLAMSLKWQTEMTMALAAIYGHDINDEEVRQRCMMLAGLGVSAGGERRGGISQQAFVDFAQARLQQYSLAVLKKLFTQLGSSGGRKAFEKMAPFGVGMLIGGGANKVSSTLAGKRVHAYLQAEFDGEVPDTLSVVDDAHLALPPPI